MRAGWGSNPQSSASEATGLIARPPLLSKLQLSAPNILCKFSVRHFVCTLRFDCTQWPSMRIGSLVATPARIRQHQQQARQHKCYLKALGITMVSTISFCHTLWYKSRKRRMRAPSYSSTTLKSFRSTIELAHRECNTV